MFGLRFKQVEAISLWDDGETTVEIKSKPWLTEWDCRILPQVRERFHPRAMGYRFLEHRLWSRTDVYARPLLVWLYLWMCLRMSRVLWGTLKVLYSWGAIHTVASRGQVLQFRDLRLGPGRECKY